MHAGCKMATAPYGAQSPQIRIADKADKDSWLGVQGARKIDFAAFQKALPLLAVEKGCRAEDVRRSIVLSEGPRRNSSVTPDFVRLHDDKTTFTGAWTLLGAPEPARCMCHSSSWPDSAHWRPCTASRACIDLQLSVTCSAVRPNVPSAIQGSTPRVDPPLLTRGSLLQPSPIAV